MIVTRGTRVRQSGFSLMIVISPLSLTLPFSFHYAESINNVCIRTAMRNAISALGPVMALKASSDFREIHVPGFQKSQTR